MIFPVFLTLGVKSGPGHVDSQLYIMKYIIIVIILILVSCKVTDVRRNQQLRIDIINIEKNIYVDTIP